MTTLAAAPANARERLLLAGERLIAEQGPAVSLREVATAADQRNNSAVHYHFGSRDGLIEAIIELRQQSLERDRLELVAAIDPGDPDPRAWVAALLLPAMTTPYAEGATHYARFIEKVRDHPYLSSEAFRERRWPATRLIINQLHRAMTDLPAQFRPLRLRAGFSTSYALLADIERGEPAYADHPRADLEQHVIDAVLNVVFGPTHPAH